MRLANMGVPAFNIASSVILITAQRLARKLCTHCKRRRTSRPRRCCRPDSPKRISTAPGRPTARSVATHCLGTGYKGRIGIYEVMPITDEMRQIIMRNGNGARHRRAGAEAKASAICASPDC